MKISMMTLGCPEWDLDMICQKGAEYGFDGVDFRGLQDEIDVTKLPAFTSDVATTRRKLNDAGLAVSGISSSITVCDTAKRATNLEEAKRTIGVAHALGAPNVRIYGGGDIANNTHEELANVGQACIEEILALDGAGSGEWVVHDILDK